MSALLCLPACAAREFPAHATVKNPMVITIAKSGKIEVNHKSVPLKKLAATLKGMGVTRNSGFKIEGETGTDQRDIDQVLGVLVENGLLPKNTID